MKLYHKNSDLIDCNCNRRTSRIVNGKKPNCSLVQIRDNRVLLFNKVELYNTGEFDITAENNKTLFFVRRIHDGDSINQSVDSDKLDDVTVGYNLAFEIMSAFEEVELGNKEILQSMQA